MTLSIVYHCVLARLQYGLQYTRSLTQAGYEAANIAEVVR